MSTAGLEPASSPKALKVERLEPTTCPNFQSPGQAHSNPSYLWPSHVLFWSVLFNLQVFWDFPTIYCGLRTDIVWFLFFYMLRWLLWPRSGLSWWMFHVGFRTVCILLLLNERVYKYPLYPVDWWWCWVQLCSYCFSVCWICLLLKKEVELSSCNSIFMYFSLKFYQFLLRMF